VKDHKEEEIGEKRKRTKEEDVDMIE